LNGSAAKAEPSGYRQSLDTVLEESFAGKLG
jgi:hypothetical protein